MVRPRELALESLVPLGATELSICSLGRAQGPQGSAAVMLRRLRDELPREQQAELLAEARRAQELAHPAILRPLLVGPWMGAQTLAVELCAAPSLAEVNLACAERGRPLAPAAVVELLGELAALLALLDGAELVHGRLSPHTLFLDRRGRLLLGGLAHRPGEQLTDLAYRPPEQIRGERLDRRADAYSAAAVGFELLTLACPFEATRPFELAGAIRARRPATPSSLRGEERGTLDRVILRALEKEPSRRFDSAQELAQALAAAAPLGPGLKEEVRQLARPESWRRRGRLARELAAGGSGPALGAVEAEGLKLLHERPRDWSVRPIPRVDSEPQGAELFVVFDTMGEGSILGVFGSRVLAERLLRLNPAYYRLKACRLNEVDQEALQFGVWR